ncbi:MAG: CoA ester lyase [Rhodobacteraceae bacterium]|nr:CoA ester lyase [Paracoccaceae bacterium]PHR55893.1 MAG: CoA ester lyase [Robiginitomaculum sp.]
MVSLDKIRAPLFVPATRPDRFEKAAASGCDAIILDLEDAVNPEEKNAARDALRCDFTDLPVLVRINGTASSHHLADMNAVLQLPIAGVVLPKSEICEATDQTIARLKRHAPVLALIETARGMVQAQDLAMHDGIERFIFGSLDYCVDLGCAHDADLLLPARMALVMASRLGALAAPIDGVTTDLSDMSTTRADAMNAKRLGMGGKLCIHPKQIAPVMQSFKSSEARIDWAKKVLALAAGVSILNGQMVDEPVRQEARAVLAAQ